MLRVAKQSVSSFPRFLRFSSQQPSRIEQLEKRIEYLEILLLNQSNSGQLNQLPIAIFNQNLTPEAGGVLNKMESRISTSLVKQIAAQTETAYLSFTRRYVNHYFIGLALCLPGVAITIANIRSMINW